MSTGHPTEAPHEPLSPTYEAPQTGEGFRAPVGYPGQGQPPQSYPGQYPQGGPIGQLRGTGVSILLFVVTLGIYGWVWYFKTHDEMKQHSGQGVGGGIALVLAIFVGFIMPFLTASETGELYARRGQEKPVSGLTGLWILLPVVGAIVWFVKTNGALNAYWRSLGAH
jgi:hypothetical protein